MAVACLGDVARYTGPRRRVVRRLGTTLPGLTRIRLPEKKKLRFHYGLSERQLRNYVECAAGRAGPTGDNLLRTLELRLDNVVFRLGLAPTIPAARQLVTHGHITRNGEVETKPGREVKVGDRVEAR